MKQQLEEAMQDINPDNHLAHDPTKSTVAKVIEWSVNNQLLVMTSMLALIVFGWLAIKSTPLDAIPDLSDTQVIIRTDFPGQAPQIIEDLVTYPLSTTMLGLPKTKDVRGFSMFGTSFVYIIFEDNVDQYWARSRVIEALSKVQGDLPSNATTQIGPDATGVGWVYQYALISSCDKYKNSSSQPTLSPQPTSSSQRKLGSSKKEKLDSSLRGNDEKAGGSKKCKQYDLAYMRTLQDWFLKFELATVSGVSEVASVGGFVKEYQVLVDPNRLRAYDVPLHRIQAAVKAASQEVGGRVLEKGEMELMIRSKGYITNLDELKKVVVYAKNGTPVILSDVARIIEGPELRRGITELNGEGEVVSGVIIMRSGENALSVIEGVKKKIEELKHGLPEGIEIVTVYDRAPLIEGAVDYLTTKLIEEGIVVALVCLIFLLHVRSAFVAIITLPLGILAAFMVMSAQGITANIMSLGGIAIAIGAMVDASVVMVENAHRKLSEMAKDASLQEKKAAILQSTKEVGPGLFFSLLIITISFMPVFALAGESYRLFSPLAFTKTYAMAAAAILSITLVPVLMLWLIRGRIRREDENPINRFFVRIYKPLLQKALNRKWLTIAISLLLLASMIIPFKYDINFQIPIIDKKIAIKKIGSEFMPALYEGELLYMPTTLPGVSITKAKEILAQTNRLIKTIPEVHHVFGKVGRADTATDPAPISMIETWIKLKPKDEWREGLTVKQLIKDLDKRVKLPGLVNSFGYPIKIRMDMVSTGIRTPVGVKISGNDLEEISRIALDVEMAVRDIRGTRSAFADRVIGGKYLEITPDRDELARQNIDLGMFQRVIQTALGGMKISESVQGRERYNIMLRYERKFREQPEDLADILIPTPQGQHIPLAELATIEFTEGPPMIKSENARLTGWVFVDIVDRDIGGYVAEAQKIVDEKVKLPAGYSIQWSGQFEQMIEAEERMKIAIPSAILIIFMLLMLHFGKLDRTLIVMLSLPFGLIGGVWALYFAGYNFSVAVSVGFIALGGIAVETAVVMLIYIDLQMRTEKPKNLRELRDVIMHGAVLRVRPKLMTVSVIIAGLTPIFITEGLGSDVMRRIALPMLGGMITTTILTLIVIPVIYYIWEGKKMRAFQRDLESQEKNITLS